MQFHHGHLIGNWVANLIAAYIPYYYKVCQISIFCPKNSTLRKYVLAKQSIWILVPNVIIFSGKKLKIFEFSRVNYKKAEFSIFFCLCDFGKKIQIFPIFHVRLQSNQKLPSEFCHKSSISRFCQNGIFTIFEQKLSLYC